MSTGVSATILPGLNQHADADRQTVCVPCAAHRRGGTAFARIFGFVAMLALAIVSLFALLPDAGDMRTVARGSAFSATTSDTCTLPRAEPGLTHQSAAKGRPPVGTGDGPCAGHAETPHTAPRMSAGPRVLAQAPVPLPPAFEHIHAEARAPPRG